MKNTQATIRDLALKLNISISTVSRALHNAPDINPETKKAVLALAKELHYEPNRVAQSLRIRKTNTLGVIVPEINLHFFSSAISGIQEYAATQNYSVIICQSLESYKTEALTTQMLVSNRVDGLLISLSGETDTDEHLQNVIRKKIPIVLFDRVRDDFESAKVIVDDQNGACKAVEHLIHTGCRRIAYIGGPRHLYISNQRLQGYYDALQKNGIPVLPSMVVQCQDLKKDPVRVVRQLLESPERPDAFFCINDPVAILIMQVVKSMNLSIPGNVSIVGFTNEPVSQYIEPSLTTVAQPSYDIGRVAAELFFEQMEKKEGFVPVTRILPTELIVRGSTK